MATQELRRTKILAPRLHPAAIRREALITQLAADAERKATLIVAPAGFGKTTLVNQWLRLPSTAEAVAWLSLEADDNDPTRFWRYLLAAWQSLNPAIGQGAAVRLQQVDMPFGLPPLEAVVTLLLNDLTTLAHPAVLVVDDYHFITHPAIHDSLSTLIEHLPPHVHIVLMARHMPPLSLSRLRAQGDLYELNTNALRFSPAELKKILAQSVSVMLSDDTITRIHERTEGWAVGVRLAILALNTAASPDAVERILDTFGGSQPAVADYFISDVLARQPDAVQSFLLYTSLVPTLTEKLADVMTGRDDSAEMVAALIRQQLFILPLEGNEGWYRYHALFAEALQHEAQQRLPLTERHALYQRVSRWYEQHAMLPEAIESALAGAAWERAIALLEPYVEGQNLSDLQDPHRLRRWLETLPTPRLHQRPLLCYSYTMALVRTEGPRAAGMMARLDALGDIIETGWRREGNWARMGELFTLRALLGLWSGNMEDAERWARQALVHLPLQDSLSRGICLGLVGGAEWHAGNLHVARRLLLEADASSATQHNGHAARAHTLMLAGVYSAQGELRLADALYHRALDNAIAEDDPSDHVSARLGLSALAYEADDLPTAEREATHALTIATQLAADYAHVHVAVRVARLEHAQQQSTTALQRLAAALARLSPHRAPALYRELLATRAALYLALGEVAAVSDWAEQLHDIEAPTSRQLQLTEALLIVRLRLAMGDPAAALNLLAGLVEHATAQGQVRRALEIELLTALAYAAQQQRDLAIATLRAILSRAHLLGFRRLFLDEGEAFAALLRATIPTLTDTPLRPYSQSLLHPFVAAQAEAGELTLLSAQERRVLALLAAGHSNHELAQTLVVSINTIKTQIRHIYRKLGVSSREEATLLARQFGVTQ